MPACFHHSNRAHRYRRICRQLVVVLPAIAITSSLGQSTDFDQRPLTGPGVSNHPVNIVPSAGMRIPPGWPLAPDGSITCKTCHASIPFPGVQGSGRPRGMDDSFSDALAFCMNCHRDTVGGSAATTHWVALPRAHILRDSFKNRFAGGGALDEASRNCLTCHDGLNASDAGHETGLSRSLANLGEKDRNHPIGVLYPQFGKRRAEVPLRPAAALPATVQLPGGMVSCVSCHDLYQPDRNRLSVPINDSRLCLTCHDLN